MKDSRALLAGEMGSTAGGARDNLLRHVSRLPSLPSKLLERIITGKLKQ